jgi:hypothetical protein
LSISLFFVLVFLHHVRMTSLTLCVSLTLQFSVFFSHLYFVIFTANFTPNSDLRNDILTVYNPYSSSGQKFRRINDIFQPQNFIRLVVSLMVVQVFVFRQVNSQGFFWVSRVFNSAELT